MYMSLIRKPQLEDYQTYGEILYFNKDYNGALKCFGQCTGKYSNQSFEILFDVWIEPFDDALPLGQTLINSTNPSELIWQDYNEYIQLLSKKQKIIRMQRNIMNLLIKRYNQIEYALQMWHGRTKKHLIIRMRVKILSKVIDKNPNLTLGDLYTGEQQGQIRL